jgi:hypothetical protein
MGMVGAGGKMASETIFDRHFSSFGVVASHLTME